MQIVLICEKFGWDWHTYMEQPKEFLDLIREKLIIDGLKAQAESKK